MPRGKSKRDTEQTADETVEDLCDKQELDLYQVLGVERTATGDDIKKAYRRMAISLHPDKNGNTKEATEQFQQLQRVYTILSDPEKRKTYDATGSLELSEEGSVGDVWGLYQAYKATLNEVNEASIAAFFRTYEQSDEERNDLINLYIKHNGRMARVLDSMISANDDDNAHRFMDILQAAVADGPIPQNADDPATGTVKSSASFTHWAKQVSAKPRPKTPLKRKQAQESNENALVQAIRGNAAKRMDDALDALAAKYTAKGGAAKKQSKGKNSAADMPSEEEFQAARSRIEGRTAAAASKATRQVSRKGSKGKSTSNGQ